MEKRKMYNAPVTELKEEQYLQASGKSRRRDLCGAGSGQTGISDEMMRSAAKYQLSVTSQSLIKHEKKFKIKERDILNKRRGLNERLIYGIVFVIFLIYAISLLSPIYYLFVNSLEKIRGYGDKIRNGNTFAFPEDPRWRNYITAFKELKCTGKSSRDPIYLPELLFNSVWYTIGVALTGIFTSALSGYALSRYKFIGRNFIYGIAVFTLTVPIIGTMAASFKMMSQLHLYNTPFYFVSTFSGLGFNFLVLYGFFKNLSWSYAEAVFIDGGGHFTAFFKIMLPQAKAPIFTLFLMSFISNWNDYQTPLLYLPDYPTLASGLYKIQEHFGRRGNWAQYFAALLISITPAILLFACFSNTIMKNFTMGGLKG